MSNCFEIKGGLHTQTCTGNVVNYNCQQQKMLQLTILVALLKLGPEGFPRHPNRRHPYAVMQQLVRPLIPQIFPDTAQMNINVTMTCC